MFPDLGRNSWNSEETVRCSRKRFCQLTRGIAPRALRPPSSSLMFMEKPMRSRSPASEIPVEAVANYTCHWTACLKRSFLNHSMNMSQKEAAGA